MKQVLTNLDPYSGLHNNYKYKCGLPANDLHSSLEYLVFLPIPSHCVHCSVLFLFTRPLPSRMLHLHLCLDLQGTFIVFPLLQGTPKVVGGGRDARLFFLGEHHGFYAAFRAEPSSELRPTVDTEHHNIHSVLYAYVNMKRTSPGGRCSTRLAGGQ